MQSQLNDEKKRRQQKREKDKESGMCRVRRVNLLLSSNLISCGAQHSGVQREGCNGNHLPSIITLLESNVMVQGA